MKTMAIKTIRRRRIVLNTLATDGECSGKALRKTLALRGNEMGVTTFYAMMKELEDQGAVTGFYVAENVKGSLLKFRHYRIVTPQLWRVSESDIIAARSPEEADEFYRQHGCTDEGFGRPERIPDRELDLAMRHTGDAGTPRLTFRESLANDAAEGCRMPYWFSSSEL